MLENYDNVFDDILLTFEEILWKGQPRRDILTSRDLLYLCFWMMWFALGVYIGYTGYFDYNNAYIIAAGAVVALLSLAMIFGRMNRKDYKDKNTYYLITNQRVIILMQLRYKRILEIELDKIKVYRKAVRRSGAGTIYLNIDLQDLIDAYHDYNLDGTDRPVKKIFSSTIFKNIPEADSVFVTLEQAIRDYKKEEAEYGNV